MGVGVERRGKGGSGRLTAIGIVLALVLSLVAGAPVEARTRSQVATCAPGVGFLGMSEALDKTTFENTNIGGLSDITYDSARGVYYSLVDSEPSTRSRFYTLSIPIGARGLGTPVVLDVTTLTDAAGDAFMARNFDGEGFTVTPWDTLFASSEVEPSIREFTLNGQLIDELPVPEKFMVETGRGRRNETFEPLAISPSGSNLFTATGEPLVGDDWTARGNGRIRILHYAHGGASGFEPSAEYFYQSDANLGIVAFIALSDTQLLVMERGFEGGVGNTVRIYRVSLRNAADVSGVESLAHTTVKPLQKTLLVDLAACPSGGATLAPGASQANALLDNFEGMTFGPRLSGGKWSLVIQSDDNFGSNQTTRIVVLAVDAAKLPVN